MRGAERKRILQAHPYCIYCGGNEPATTVDHMPNRGMFPNSHRPAGFEFPSCMACNSGSTWAEDTASFIGSIQLESTKKGVEHFERKLAQMSNNYPAILQSMAPTKQQRNRASNILYGDNETAGALSLSSPVISSAMHLYGAKLAFALHWKETGKIISQRERIGVLWFSNAQAFEDDIPQQLFDLLPDGETLEAGAFHVRDSFEYSSRRTTDSDATAHWVIFGQAFMYMLFVGENLTMNTLDSDQVFRPNCFANSKPRFDTIFPSNSTWLPYTG